jgi:hypothetical protein
LIEKSGLAVNEPSRQGYRAKWRWSKQKGRPSMGGLGQIRLAGFRLPDGSGFVLTSS